ncbi:MAG: CopG family transcriptional regulator [Halanaerobiaceae bacterium]
MPEGKATIKIPRQLYNKLQVIIEDTGFNSVTDFVVYVLRDLAAEKMADINNSEQSEDDLTNEEISAIRKRLQNLGYLS